MDPIEIDREKRNFLLDMCIEMFPEYKTILWNKSFEYDKLWFGSRLKYKPIKMEWYWFELCITELPRRIKERLSIIFDMEEKKHMSDMVEFNIFNDDYLQYEPEIYDGVDVLSLYLNNNTHPVISNYKEYLKIKRWKAQ